MRCLTAFVIIACPACATRYVVPDSAIGVDGRTVRCAKCRHSWFQDGPALGVEPSAPPPPAPPPPPPTPPSPPPIAEPQPVDEEPAMPAEQAAPEPTSEYPQPEPAVSEPASPDVDEPLPAPPPVYADPEPEQVYAEDDYSSFAHEPPFRPRRNPARMWTLAAVLFAVLALAAIAATARWGLPDWVPLARPTFAEAQPGLVLEFPPNRQDRRRLPDGSEFFGANGTVTNVGRTGRSVPAILVVLRDARNRIVYSAEMAPPQRVLAPGESEAINEALADIPKAAKFAEFGWKPG